MRAGQKMTPEQRERQSRAQKEAWSRPEYKERQSRAQKVAQNRLEVKERKSRAQKETWASPEYKESQSRTQKEAWATPELRERQSKAAKEAWGKLEVKERHSKASKEVCAIPEVKERRSRAQKVVQKEVQNRPEVRAKKSGPNSYLWKGGISFEPYCHKFTRQLKNEVRAAFGYKCYLCPHIQNGKKLSIHHVDYDKNDICNGKKWPLIPLCHKCHGKTNHNRWYWFNLLMNYWAMNPEINFEGICD